MKLHKLSIKEIRNKIIKGSISVKEVCEYYIDRIKKYGLKDGTNSVCAINPNYEKEIELLLEKGDMTLPLYGIPYLVKDNIDVYGMPTTAGSLCLVDNYPNDDSFIVKKLRDNGAIILGKCNMMELANYLDDIPDGYSSFGGTVLNSFNKNLSSGGSSSGSASAMAFSLCPFTIGTDTSYSVISCASCNGVFGFKPSNKNVNGKGILPITNYLDTVGVFAKRFSDLNLVSKVILDKNINEEVTVSNNIGIDEKNIESLSKGRINFIYNFVDEMMKYDFKFEEIKFDQDGPIYELMKRDYANSLNEYLKDTKSKVRNMADLVKAYKENELANKYGHSILDKALAYYKEKSNNKRIKEIIKFKEDTIKDYVSTFEMYDAVIITGFNTNIHFYNMPSISIPVKYNKELRIPENIIMYSNDESKLLSVSSYICDLLEEMPYPRDYYKKINNESDN